jgi:hypothetical protein
MPRHFVSTSLLLVEILGPLVKEIKRFSKPLSCRAEPFGKTRHPIRDRREICASTHTSDGERLNAVLSELRTPWLVLQALGDRELAFRFVGASSLLKKLRQ